jgi:hypothetical protein
VKPWKTIDAADPLKYLRKRGYPKAPNPDANDMTHPVTGKKYTSDAARFGDGLPDTGILIGNMTQAARDKILMHPAIRTARRGE